MGPIMPDLWPAGPFAPPHFRVDDFACHDEHATRYPASLVESVLMPLCRDILEPIRRFVCGDKAVLVLSGYRTPTWNTHEGGAPNSRHVHGDAADIWCPSLGPAAGPALYLAILSLHRAGLLPALGGLGKYSNRVHVDARPHAPQQLATWDFTSSGARG